MSDVRDHVLGRSFGIIVRLCHLVVLFELSHTLNNSLLITDNEVTRVTSHHLEVKVNMLSGTALGFMLTMLWEAKNLAASTSEKFLLR